MIGSRQMLYCKFINRFDLTVKEKVTPPVLSTDVIFFLIHEWKFKTTLDISNKIYMYFRRMELFKGDPEQKRKIFFSLSLSFKKNSWVFRIKCRKCIYDNSMQSYFLWDCRIFFQHLNPREIVHKQGRNGSQFVNNCGKL